MADDGTNVRLQLEVGEKAVFPGAAMEADRHLAHPPYAARPPFNQGNHVTGDAWTRVAPLGATSPEKGEALSVQPENRLGLDQGYRIAPPRREPSEEDDEGPIGWAQLQPVFKPG